MKAYIVYVKQNDSGYVTHVNSSAFLSDPSGWAQIDEGTGDRHHHAQGNYFPESIITDGGAYRYKLVDGKPVECTAEEIAAQVEALKPVPRPTLESRVEVLETTTDDMILLMADLIGGE
ncbi:MAG: hypothetical protein Q4P84_04940 [Elusimicrobiales bacterium]|nr:hypothetical protein [Elusimicrobiales bacterium]